MTTHTQLLVIGAGPGGYASAFRAADLGVKVTLVDAQKALGGVCLSRGCIPSKALLHVARILSDSREAREIGIEFQTPNINIDKIREWQNNVVSKLTAGLQQLCRQRKIDFVQGKASFLNSGTAKIETADSAAQELSFDNAIIAAGSRPISLPFAPKSSRILDSTSALDIKDIPGKLLVIGGGYIGLELATVYCEIGSRVSVVEMTPHLLPGVDRDLVRPLEKRLQTRFESIRPNTKVTGMKETQSGIAVTLEDKDGKTSTEEFDKVLVAVGRMPDAEGLGLQNTNVKIKEDGFIEVNKERRTSDPKIYAIGDITGNPMLAHKASQEGRVAAEAIAGQKATFEPGAIPAVVFTDPEIAWCGLTETKAKEKNIPVKIAKFPWAASGRAITLNRTDGLTKLLVCPQTERILGVGIVGAGAGELIAEGVLAIEMGATAGDLKRCIHPHPTLSETVMECAEGFFGASTHLYRPSAGEK